MKAILKRWLPLCFFIPFLLTLIYGFLYNDFQPVISGILFLFVTGYCWIARPSSGLHKITMKNSRTLLKRVLLIQLTVQCSVCGALMFVSPHWCGKEHEPSLKQYELMAESLLDGHLYLNYSEYSEDALSLLNNPWDPEERAEKLDNQYPRDTAFFNGKFYMYFGIVPVLLLFLPFRLITGIALPTVYATMLMVILIIVSMYRLFWKLSARLFPEIDIITFLSLSLSLTVLSTYYFIEFPNLYCTAISSGVFFEICSLMLFSRAVWIEKKEKRQLVFIFLGSLCGALTFGCRPPVGLANVIALPMLPVYLKQKKKNKQLIRKLFVALSPYIIVGFLLMLYNKTRFNNPLEFGQAYQLTVMDQRIFTDLLSRIKACFSGFNLLQPFIQLPDLVSAFPFIIEFGGIWITFPITLSPFFLFSGRARSFLKTDHSFATIFTLMAVPFLVIVFQLLFSPFLIERYKWDYLYLIAIAAFFAIGITLTSIKNVKCSNRFSFLLCGLCLITLVTVFLLFITPFDFNITGMKPAILKTIEKSVLFIYRIY